MSWRRFTTLLGGLSIDSRWHQSRRARDPLAARHTRVIDTAKDPEGARAFFDSLKTRRN